MREFPAEGDGEAEGGAARLAEPGREQHGGGGGLAEGGQAHVGGLGGALLEDARLVLVVVLVHVVDRVALPEQGGGLYEVARQAFGGEPEVVGPGRLLRGERPHRGALQQGRGRGLGESGECDLFEVAVGRGGRGVGGHGDQEGALGGGAQEFLEPGAAGLQVVDDDDGADFADAVQEFPVAGAPARGVVHGGVQGVQQVRGALPVAAEADDAVGGEPGAVGGHRVEEGGTAGSGGPGDTYGAAAGEQAHQALAVRVAFEEGQLGEGVEGGAGRYGRQGGRARAARSSADRLATVVCGASGRRGSISLPSTGLTVRTKSPQSSWVIRAGPGRRPSAPPSSSAPPSPCMRSMAQAPRSRRAPSFLPAFAHSAVAAGPASAHGFSTSRHGRTLDVGQVSRNRRGPIRTGASRYGLGRARGEGAFRRRRGRRRAARGPRAGARCGTGAGVRATGVRAGPRAGVRRGAGTPRRGRPRWRGSGAAGWPRAAAASAGAHRAGRAGGRSGRPGDGRP